MIKWNKEDDFGVPCIPLVCNWTALLPSLIGAVGQIAGGALSNSGGGGGGTTPGNGQRPSSYFASAVPASYDTAMAMQHGGLPFLRNFNAPFDVPHGTPPSNPWTPVEAPAKQSNAMGMFGNLFIPPELNLIMHHSSPLKALNPFAGFIGPK